MYDISLVTRARGGCYVLRLSVEREQVTRVVAVVCRLKPQFSIFIVVLFCVVCVCTRVLCYIALVSGC